MKGTNGRKPYPDNRPGAFMRLPAQDHGVVLRHGDGCDNFGARDVFAWEHDGIYYMHYDAADSEKGWLCALATSRDLVHWEKHGTVLEMGKPGEEDSKSASYGTTYFEDGTWHMFYLGTPNASPAPERVPAFPYLTMKAVAPSPRGPWVKQREVTPFRTAAASYYCSTASPGQIIKYHGEYLQFFSASTGSFTGDAAPVGVKRTLGIARTRDLDGKWQIDANPILPLEEQIENSSLYYEEETGTWFLFTNHVGVEEPSGEYTDAIWVYWSKDINRWDASDKAIVLDGENCTWSKKIVGLPSVIRAGDRLAVLYDGLAGEGISHCHRDIGLAWLDLPLKAPCE